MKLFPKKFLSYSAIYLWNANKEQFRKKYYENICLPDTKYTLFGKEIEKRIYEGKYPDVPFYGGEQTKLQTEINEIPIIGYLDSFDVEQKKFLDYKTSTKPWTAVDVAKLNQLPFYSLLVKKIYGDVSPLCKIVWLETKLIPSKGLLTNGDFIEYTGKFEVFERNVLEWERKRMIDWITKSANEISDDYVGYLENKKSLAKP